MDAQRRRRCGRLAPGLGAMLLLGTACGRGPQSVPTQSAPRTSAGRALPRLGYTLQAGAFSKVEHAARFAEVLKAQGLEAAYYDAGDGWYRVRFGDFATRDKARARGEALRSARVIEAFWVVAPDGTAPGAAGRSRIHPMDEHSLRASLVDTARAYLGVPYLFGGTTERGFDCSGLTGAVYRLNGLRLPRSSQAQFEAGRGIGLDEARPGDLVFFGTGGSARVNHVGMIVGSGAFIHAPRPGQGIRLDDLKDRYYQKAFLGVRSYL